VDWQVASAQARTLAENWQPFQVELTDIHLFDATEVIYIEVGKGAEELRRMHDAMNAGPLGFTEPFSYCPHITLAQQIPHERVEELRSEATRRWKEYAGPRSFRAENAVFVRNIADDVWTDLAEYSLGGALAVR
jgi:2'-5' RNA ligase